MAWHGKFTPPKLKSWHSDTPPPQRQQPSMSPLPPPQPGLGVSAESSVGANFGFGTSNDYLHNHGAAHPSGCRLQGFGCAAHNNFCPPSNVHEGIQRAMEKKMIREEIIAAETARRRILVRSRSEGRNQIGERIGYES
ncbi:OLC1v1013442C1 [Oldenlandia corymbosa var. corymbosa]|uniref:OLC1v1013442C1 n=1 Tax=Oldenlandia corymbosa var. corymbosa TaxID=529605 RepID=A0AAV1DYK3_OLDCO|nr:OLC1v1013442C1 [Oldenlandia corymbosa var. corymbosa]